ncbi:hypothetical protein ABZ626_19900 [Streptomyces longispororuber]|uniref:hypothetical protein n=1 Tax=Streptomyces TaxID=1883 RepID=UPI0024A886D0|nr:hypothetical protein [Streptomyces sp. CC224B]
MNDTQDTVPGDAESPSPDLVQVVLGECSPADADAVFGVLREHFDSDRGGDAPHQTDETEQERRPAVWTGAFRAPRTPDSVSGVLLSGPVTADLQGGPQAVGHVQATLGSAFDVSVQGKASGDQEVEVQLRLTGADRGRPGPG